MASYVQSSAPHIRTQEKVTGFFIKPAAALLPVLIAALAVFRFDAVLLLSAALTTAIVFECADSALRAKKWNLQNGSYLLEALLFSLMLPRDCHPAAAIIALAAAYLFAKLAFGGFAQNPVNPAVAALAALQISVPAVFEKSVIAAPAHLEEFFRILLFHRGDLLCETSYGLVLLAVLILISQKMIRWEVPLYFLLPAVCYSLILKDASFFFQPEMLLAAFFLIPLPPYAPLGRGPHRISAAVSGIIYLLLFRFSPYPRPLVFAILGAQLVSPVIESLVSTSFKPGKTA